MKIFKRTSISYLMACLTTLMLLTTSCIRDEQDDCGLNLTFHYTYNIKDADAFTNETDSAMLYIFDNYGNFLRRQAADKAQLRDGKTMHISDLPKGVYRFVAFAQSATQTDQKANFLFPTLKKGSRMDDLTAKLQTENNLSQIKLNNLLNGTLTANVTGVAQTLDMNMMKLTHTLRIILVPTGEGAPKYLNAANYDFKVTDNNTLLGYDASRLKGDSVTYQPYWKGISKDSTDNTGSNINSAVLAELSFSRLFADGKPKLVIRDNLNNVEVINISLTWFLTLTELEEHHTPWSNQEYLDRQDEYSIVFYLSVKPSPGSNDHTWMLTRIVINGWVLNPVDIAL